jgi:hypothetical protein
MNFLLPVNETRTFSFEPDLVTALIPEPTNPD